MLDTKCEPWLRSTRSELNRRITPTKMPTGNGETILVVDDEVTILNLVKICLHRLDYMVLTATMPGEALRLAEIHIEKIDLVITDVIMPEMNGRELTRRLMSLKQDLKYLFMSGYTAEVIGDRGLMEAGAGFIQKPFTMDTLAVKVCETLSEHR